MGDPSAEKPRNATPTPPSRPSKPRVVPVLNNRLGNIQIQTGRGAKGHHDGAKTLYLVAGMNLVPELAWTAAKTQSRVQAMMKEKIKSLGIQEDAEARVGEFVLVEGEPLDAENPIGDLDEDGALLFVERTESLEALEKFTAQPLLPLVMLAVTAKIRDIKDPKNQPEKKRTA